MRGVAEYLDRIYELPAPPSGLDFIARHVRHVLKLTTTIRLNVPIDYTAHIH
ncbi:hypothetical protein ES703_49229 [subsurface metagenome]